MSLQVWLPLTKDLRNQGLSNVTVTNYGATLDNNGKLGKCYYFDGTDDRITVSGLSLPNVWSYSCWIYSATSSRSWEAVIMLNSTGGDSDLQLGFYTYPSGNKIQNTANGQYNSNIAWTYGMWHHFCGTFDGSNLKTYIDGILIDTKAITASLLSRTNLTIGARSTNAANTTAGTFFQGRLNDVRIYDHCLSLMEVKELSKGLVLHYPLNRGGWGQENLVTGSNTNSLSTNNWAIGSQTGGNTRTIEQDETGTYCVKFVRDSTAQSGWYFLSYGNLLRNQIKTDTIYTLTFDCKASVNSSITFTGLLNGNATNYMTNSTTNIQSSVVANQWCHMKYQCKTISSFDSITIGSQVVYLAPQAALKAVGVTVYFKNIKLEEGSIATPWCPNSSDALATTMGLNGTTEYDCSGFCNNGTRIGTFSWTSDMPKYNVSQVFASGNNYIDCGASQEVLPTDGLTVSLWTNYSTWSNPISCTEGGGWNFENSSGIQFPVYVASVGYKVANSGVATSTLQNGWHMLTGTFDKTNVKIYIDGILKATTATGSTNGIGYAANHCYVGAEAAGSTSIASAALVGKISDVRIYATALSADDVKSLYQNCATIDPDGTIRGQIRS